MTATKEPHKVASIIVAAINEEETISRVIESLLRQTYKNMEILIVDCGSTDGTVQIVERYTNNDANQSPSLYLIQIPHRAVSYARNEGIKSARGDVILILDADQVPFDEHFIERCMDFFEDQKVMLLFPLEKPIIVGEASLVQRVLYCEQLMHQGPTYVPRAIRKLVFSKIGYYREQLNYFEDVDLYHRIEKNYSLKTDSYRIVKTNETGFYHIVNLKKRASSKSVIKTGLKAGYNIIPLLKWNLLLNPRRMLPFLLKRLVFYVFVLLVPLSLIFLMNTPLPAILAFLILFYCVSTVADAIRKTRMIQSALLPPLRFIRGISEMAGMAIYFKNVLMGADKP